VQNYGDAPSSSLPRPADAVALKIFRKDAKEWERFDFPADTPHGARIRAVAREVVDYLLGKRGPIADAADGRVCIEMILAAYESAREGKRVAL
jgi:predicted dehydrogenase